MLGKGFERITGELSGRWLDLGANSVSGSISVMRREIPANERADATGRAHDDNSASAGAAGAEASA